MYMPTNGLIDPVTTHGELMVLPVIKCSNTWVTGFCASKSLGVRKEEKWRENWHGRCNGGGYSIMIEQKLLKLNAYAIITKQPHYICDFERVLRTTQIILTIINLWMTLIQLHNPLDSAGLMLNLNN